jgi:hypothetical protein
MIQTCSIYLSIVHVKNMNVDNVYDFVSGTNIERKMWPHVNGSQQHDT